MKVRAYNLIDLFIIAVLLGATSSALAQGEAGAQFLDIGIGAKASAMSKAFTAIADDPSAIYWNPAGMTQFNSLEIMVSQNFWLLEMNSQFGGIVVPTNMGMIGAAIIYSSAGEIPQYEDFEYKGDYSAYDLEGILAYAKDIGPRFSIGGAFKLITQKIEEESAGGFALDLGLLSKIDQAGKLKAGFTVQNMGGSVKFIDQEDPLPLNIRGGVSYRMGAFTLAGDLTKPKDDDICSSVGGEYLFNKMLAIRTGYDTSNSFSLGMGIELHKIGFGYAFVPYNDIGDSHRITVSSRF